MAALYCTRLLQHYIFINFHIVFPHSINLLKYGGTDLIANSHYQVGKIANSSWVSASFYVQIFISCLVIYPLLRNKSQKTTYVELILTFCPKINFCKYADSPCIISNTTYATHFCWNARDPLQHWETFFCGFFTPYCWQLSFTWPLFSWI